MCISIYRRVLIVVGYNCQMMVFFCRITATTEIDPEWHTLALHDALPISVTCDVRWTAHGEAALGALAAAVDSARAADPLSPVTVVTPSPSVAVRSEEHTSELQSLMRTSYAVFCLKKHTHHSHRLRLRHIVH